MSDKVKKGFKKIGLYLGITLVILLGLLFACVVYLFVYPEGNIFGYVYASDKRVALYCVNNYSAGQISGIHLETVECDVSVIISDQYEEVRAYLHNNCSGYVKKSKSKTGLSVIVNPESKTLEIKTKELSGLLLNNNSKINLIVPHLFFERGDFDFIIKTKKSSDVSIGGNASYGSKLDLLDISVNRGSVFIDDLSINKLKIKASRSSIKCGDNLTGNMELLELDIGNSKVNFMKAGNAYAELEKETPNISAINFNIDNVVLKSARKKAKILILKCKNVNTATGVVIERGNLKLSFLAGKMEINSKNFSVEIGEISSASSTARFSASGAGKIKIHKTNAVCSLKANKGKIEIGQASNSLVLETGSGDIIVPKATKSVTAISKSGDVSITFGDVGDYIIGSNGLRKIDLLRVGSSSVKIVGVDNINVVAGEKANVNIKYHKVVGENNYTTNGSKIKIVVPINNELKIVVEGNESLVGIQVGVLKREKSKLIKGVKIDECVYGETGEHIIMINATAGEVDMYSENLL